MKPSLSRHGFMWQITELFRYGLFAAALAMSPSFVRGEPIPQPTLPAGLQWRDASDNRFKPSDLIRASWKQRFTDTGYIYADAGYWGRVTVNGQVYPAFVPRFGRDNPIALVDGRWMKPTVTADYLGYAYQQSLNPGRILAGPGGHWETIRDGSIPDHALPIVRMKHNGQLVDVFAVSVLVTKTNGSREESWTAAGLTWKGLNGYYFMSPGKFTDENPNAPFKPGIQSFANTRHRILVRDEPLPAKPTTKKGGGSLIPR